MTKRMGAISAKRGMARPPSPGLGPRRGHAAREASPAIRRVSLQAHEVVHTTAGDVETRIAALEQQRALDHGYFAEIAQAVHLLYGAAELERDKRVQLEEFVSSQQQLHIDMRREFYTAMRDHDGRINAAQEAFNRLQPDIDANKKKIAEAEAAFVEMRASVEQLKGKEEAVEKYLTKLHGDRPSRARPCSRASKSLIMRCPRSER